jgi:hypothetical protein
MDSAEWLDLLGKDSADAKVKDALSKGGVHLIPPVAKDELDTRVKVDGLMLIFSVVDLFPGRTGGDGTYVLSGLVFPLKLKWGEYKGELPYKLKQTDSQKELRSRFGEPTEHNENLFWDEWTIDKLLVRAKYTPDGKSLASVTIRLPVEV